MRLGCGRREDDLRTECRVCRAHHLARLEDWRCSTCDAGPNRPGGKDVCEACGEPDPRRPRLVEEVARLRRTPKGADGWANYAESALEGDRDEENRSSLELQGFLLSLRGLGEEGSGYNVSAMNPQWILKLSAETKSPEKREETACENRSGNVDCACFPAVVRIIG